MAFDFELTNKVLACLKSNPDKRFTAHQISKWIFGHYPKDCERKRQESKQDLSSDKALINQISSQIKLSMFKNHECVKIIAGRPRQYYWTEESDE